MNKLVENIGLQLSPQQVSIDVLLEKYAKEGESNIHDIRYRVASALACIEDHPEKYKSEFLFALENGFIPGGRINSSAGTDLQATLINCFVQPISDSISSKDGEEAGIYNALLEAAESMRRGGGVGYNFSKLRPLNAKVKGTNSRASGPLSYMRVFDRSCETVESAGARRGAQMGVLDISHPDILSFITAKSQGDLKNFNISVGVSDSFMISLVNNLDFNLFHAAEPSDELIKEGAYLDYQSGMWVYKTLKASVIWDAIMKNTYAAAEPGVLFIDKINSHNNLSYIEIIEATNPCGEQPLPPYGCCCLGSMNITKFVKNPFSDNPKFDLELFEKVVTTSVRMLDNVLDISIWPLPQQKTEAANKRRVGLGYTGLGSALVMMGLKYNSKEARDFAETITKVLSNTAYKASSNLAVEKGSFPLFDAKKYLADGHFASSLPTPTIKMIQKQGMRNSHLISIAPTGTISLAFADNCSNGIEPAFSWSYQRKKRLAEGGHQMYDVEDHAYRVYRELGGDVEKLPEQFVSALDISANDHLLMVSAIAPYIDSAISKTVNVPEDYPFEDFKNLYMDAWKFGLKGITTFRPNNITGSVLMTSPEVKSETKEQFDLTDPDRRIKLKAIPKPANNSLIWRKRPFSAAGHASQIYMINHHQGSFSVMITHDQINGLTIPFEVWVNGAEAPRGLASLAKSLSMDMRSHDAAWVQTKLKSLMKCSGDDYFDMPDPATGNTIRFNSLVQAFAHIVHHRCNELGMFNNIEQTPMLDALYSNKEPKTTADGSITWSVDVFNPATGDDFLLTLKEADLPDGTRAPQSVWLSGNYPSTLDGLCKILSYDMRIVDTAWVGSKLRQIRDFYENGGGFFAQVPGEQNKVFYQSTVAYMISLIIHRYSMLGILDKEANPVKKMGYLRIDDNKQSHLGIKTVSGSKCPVCSFNTVIKQGGCSLCTADGCGYVGNCG